MDRSMQRTLSESVWRFGIFLAVLAALALLEVWLGGPNPSPQRTQRWPANAGLVVFDTLIARVLLPTGAVGVAVWCQARGVGLLNGLAWPYWLKCALALVVLDLAIYWQHRWLHVLPWLWPLHRVHHTDITLDASSALRFHPLEILLSLAYKLALVFAFGIAPLAVLVFETLLSSFALITHANLALPPRLDRVIRWLLVTPAMHWIHHSTHVAEQHRNFGFHLSIWDRLFGSYAAQSRDVPQAFGVEHVDAGDALRFTRLLREPFVSR